MLQIVSERERHAKKNQTRIHIENINQLCAHSVNSAKIQIK